MGGIFSDSSERLLPRGSGARSIYKVLMKVEFNTMKHSLYKRFFAIHEELMSSHMKGFIAFLDMR